MHVIAIDVEDCLDQWRFTTHHDELIICIVKGRANSTWITHYEGISMSQEASNAISTIPKTGGTTEDPCDVDVLCDETEACLWTVTCC